MWNLKYDTNKCIYERKTDSQTERTDLWLTKRRGILSPEYSLEGLMLKLQYFGHLLWRTDSFEKILMLGKIESGRRRGGQRMRWLDDITNSKDKSVSKLWSCWWTRKPGMLRSIGVAKTWTQLSDWTELNICLGHTVYTKTAIPPPFLFIVIVHLLVTPRAGTVPNHSCWALHPWSQCK